MLKTTTWINSRSELCNTLKAFHDFSHKYNINNNNKKIKKIKNHLLILAYNSFFCGTGVPLRNKKRRSYKRGGPSWWGQFSIVLVYQCMKNLDWYKELAVGESGLIRGETTVQLSFLTKHVYSAPSVYRPLFYRQPRLLPKILVCPDFPR